MEALEEEDARPSGSLLCIAKYFMIVSKRESAAAAAPAHSPEEPSQMFKRILAIAFILVCTSIAWAVLGSTIFYRTYNSDSSLRGRVVSSWGAPQEQGPPTAGYTELREKYVVAAEDGKQAHKVEERCWVGLAVEKSRVQAGLHLEHRQKGLLWYSTYSVQFAGAYQFTYAGYTPRDITFTLHLPAEQAIYDDIAFSANGVPLAVKNEKTEAFAVFPVKPHETVNLEVGYRSQGMESWQYKFGDKVAQVRDFQLRVTTDFHDYDLQENTLSPTEKTPTQNGWVLVWDYKNLVSGYQIGLGMPAKLQPGPLAGRISYFAPVSLFFFFFILFVLTTIRGIELHPMNYFFLACAFFSFHLLMAYLVDHISIHAAFVVCSAVSIFLVVSYLRLMAGMRFAAVEAGLAQFIYLVLFSYAFFFQGFTGLAVTIGAIITLFVVMQITGRIRWAEKFAPRRAEG
jgi:inner membrane protein involved in colicin E2 resistance